MNVPISGNIWGSDLFDISWEILPLLSWLFIVALTVDIMTQFISVAGEKKEGRDRGNDYLAESNML